MAFFGYGLVPRKVLCVDTRARGSSGRGGLYGQHCIPAMVENVTRRMPWTESNRPQLW